MIRALKPRDASGWFSLAGFAVALVGGALISLRWSLVVFGTALALFALVDLDQNAAQALPNHIEP